jgi:ribosomal protein L29
MDEKVEVYQGTLHDAYEGTPEKFILDQDHLLTKVFFSIDSVQNELKQMSPDQRQLEINRIRKKMGLTEKQVESMAKRDADNELRWEAGLQYMKEREAVVQQYSGQEQEEKLSALREQYFDDEAKTIELEEKGDFYRFKRPHIYGRN